MKPLLVTDAALRSRCREYFPLLPANAVVLLDDSYQVLQGEQADAAFARMAAQADKVFPGGYQVKRKDCDKYSRVVAALAMAAHAMQDGPDAGLALGVLNYDRDASRTPLGEISGHSVNVLFVRFKGQQRIDILVYEPQTGERMELTLAERRRAKLIIV